MNVLERAGKDEVQGSGRGRSLTRLTPACKTPVAVAKHLIKDSLAQVQTQSTPNTPTVATASAIFTGVHGGTRRFNGSAHKTCLTSVRYDGHKTL